MTLGAMGAWAQNTIINLSTLTVDITVGDGYTLTGTLDNNHKISIENSTTVMLNNVTQVTATKGSNSNNIGRLYDWYDAMDTTRPAKAVRVQGICPDGWFMPTQEDFDALDNTDLQDLRSTHFWVVNDGNNSTGFDMRGSGMYDIDDARYEELLCKAYFWTAAATSSTEAHCREARYFCNTFIDLVRNKENAFSVRCVKD